MQAQTDGLLACANQLLTEGRDSAALKIFQRLYDSGKTDGVRQAAFCGVILASGRSGVKLMSRAIAGNDSASQGAALHVAATLKGADVTKALADLLPKVQTPVQIALLQCLQQRGDSSAAPAVAQLLGSSDPGRPPGGDQSFGRFGRRFRRASARPRRSLLHRRGKKRRPAGPGGLAPRPGHTGLAGILRHGQSGGAGGS